MSASSRTRSTSGKKRREETMEELEAQIAERMATMPDKEMELDDPVKKPKKPRVYVIRCDRRWNRSVY